MKVFSIRFIRMATVALVMLLALSSLAYAEYNRDHVVEVMRNNIALMGEIGGAAEAEDWYLAAQKLYAIAEGMMGIMIYTPPKGSEDDFEATLEEFVNAAFIGIGACGAQDAEGLQQAIASLKALNRQGHRAHK